MVILDCSPCGCIARKTSITHKTAVHIAGADKVIWALLTMPQDCADAFDTGSITNVHVPVSLVGGFAACAIK